MIKKISVLIVVMITIVLNGCSTQRIPHIGKKISYFDNYEALMVNFNREFEVSMQLRQDAVYFYNQEKAEGDKQFFTATDIRHIHNAINSYIKNRNYLLNNIVYKYKNLIEHTELIISKTEPTHSVVLTDNNAFYKKRLTINPNDELGRDYIKAIKLALAAALTLYDNFIIAIMPYESNGAWRRKINYDNIDNAKIIEKISRNFSNTGNYQQALKVSHFYKKVKKWEQNNPKSSLVKDTDNAYFNVIINGSFTFNEIDKITVDDRIAYDEKRTRRILADTLLDTTSNIINKVSQLFGNTVGLIALRKGYLKKMTPSQVKKIKQTLQAGDIILEKTPFRYTDQFIPGHWGHVAIWVGDKQNLQAIGVWDKLPELYKKAKKRFNYKGEPFQKQILAGKKMVEALRSGVQINTLEHFLNIDDFAVLRAKQITKAKLQKYVLKTFEQIGKDYDFNFDVETDTAIVCSELAFIAYEDYDWRVERTLGRYTISPDNVAEKVGDKQPLKVVMLYHDGKKVINNLTANFKNLLHGRYDNIQKDLVVINVN